MAPPAAVDNPSSLFEWYKVLPTPLIKIVWVSVKVKSGLMCDSVRDLVDTYKYLLELLIEMLQLLFQKIE